MSAFFILYKNFIVRDSAAEERGWLAWRYPVCLLKF